MRTLELVVVVAFALAGACAPFSGDPLPADAGAGGDASSPAEGGTPEGGTGPAGKRLVFLSGGQLTPGPAMETQAHALCTAEGQLARPAATFVPWLSTTTAAVSRLRAGPAWALAGGEVVFSDLAAVTKPPLLHVIDTDALGKTRPSGTKAWTGTALNGLQKTKEAALSCASYTSGDSGIRGRVGSPTDRVDEKWTDTGDSPCNEPGSIICFEQ